MAIITFLGAKRALLEHIKARGHKIIEAEESFQICEEVESYNALFDAEKCDIAQKNTCNWNEIDEFPVG